jgi:hypothetical protein
VSSNPGCGVSTNVENSSGFKKNFDALVASLPTSKSKDTKLYIGLLGLTSAGVSGDYLDPTLEAAPLIKAHFCNPYFGGIMTLTQATLSKMSGEMENRFTRRSRDILASDSTDTKDFTCATTRTLAAQAAPTGGISGERVTTITMTLCPSAPGSFSTSSIYANSTARSMANYTSAL